MKQSSMNRLANTRNQFQGDTKRVLTVCSAGLLRSPSLAVLLSQEPYNYNTRAAGSNEEYALVPIDDALITWADLIVFVNEENKLQAERNFSELLAKKQVIVLDIEDSYPYRDPELMTELKTLFDAKYQDGRYDG